MIVYYFGADTLWQPQKENTIRRRNMAILSAIIKNKNVTKIYNVVRCDRSLFFQKLKEKGELEDRVNNIFIAPILPERGILRCLTRPINRFLIKKSYPDAFTLNNKKAISWCYWPQGFKDYEYLGLKNDLIFDTDHNIIEDPNLPKEQRLKRKQLLVEVGNQAKLILSSSRSMLKWYEKEGFLNTQLLMNGVFKQRVNLIKRKKNETSYQVTYCGTLSKWMNAEWLFKLANDHPDWIINIVGKNYKTEIAEQLETYNNIKLHGFLEPEAVDALLKKADVCFGLYQEEPFLDVNSMKLYDYLAQGIPVVVNNYHPNLNIDFNDLLNMASTYDEFVALLKNPKPLDLQKLELFLESSTWEHRIKLVLQQSKISLTA